MGGGEVGARKETCTMGNGMGRRGLTVYARTEVSGKSRSEGGISLPGRVEARMAIIKYMATLATDGNTRMGREVPYRVETQWG